jgi:hypothetical protein
VEVKDCISVLSKRVDSVEDINAQDGNVVRNFHPDTKFSIRERAVNSDHGINASILVD